MAEPSGPRASFLQRFGAALIDGILIAIVAVVLEAAIGRSVGSLVALALGIAYYGWLEGSPSGQTVGKRALGIRVYDFRAGGPIGTSRGILRYFARILSAIPFFLGYFWMLWDAEKQTWHDKIAGSVVVPASAYPLSVRPANVAATQPVFEPEPEPEPEPESLEDEQQRKFDEREKQWGR
jgi:uncharacterized RDD family membrane protein YckC